MEFFMANQKGQASSVFQLLIAAIVSLAILVILLQILDIIDIFPRGDPVREAPNVVTQAKTNLASLQYSQKVIFEPQKTVTARAIALAVGGITEDQICLSIGGMKPESFSENSNKKAIAYVGTTSKDAKLAAVCDYGKGVRSTISESFEENGGFSSSWLDGCNCAEDSFEDICCVVALKVP